MPMLLPKYEQLPPNLQIPEVKPYYDSLKHKQGQLLCKRLFDLFAALVLLILLSPLFLGVAIWIKCDSSGPVFFRQTRITQFGKPFCILKFRTMVENAPLLGAQVTSKEDVRVTKSGKILRSFRLDELPQLLNILSGKMSLVGVRPEVPYYVRKYTPEMMATLLLPAGVTSPASIAFAREAELLTHTDNLETTYIQQILPQKMAQNLSYLKKFSFFSDMQILWDTVQAVFFPRKEKGI